MANEEHVAFLKQGREAWNTWEQKFPDIRPDLTDADLSGAFLVPTNQDGVPLVGPGMVGVPLYRADLTRATLVNATLVGANLVSADLTDADLSGARLHGAALGHATLVRVNLAHATLVGANLVGANLVGANLVGADLSGAILSETVFGNTDLTGAKRLEDCNHHGPSTIDHRTLQRSGPLPLAFLRGVGLPDNLIDYLPSLLNQPIQFYSCFISYSGKDQEFADRLHADLQNKGVRCWFAPHDMPIGARIIDAIDEAIRLRDKVLLVLSRNAIESDWVEDEVTKAFAEERARKQLVLFPVRLDDAVMETAEAWAGKLRDGRNIGDFRRWKNHDVYQKALERVLRDLKVAQAGP